LTLDGNEADLRRLIFYRQYLARFPCQFDPEADGFLGHLESVLDCESFGDDTQRWHAGVAHILGCRSAAHQAVEIPSFALEKGGHAEVAIACHPT
jgi:hypothetical protein